MSETGDAIGFRQQLSTTSCEAFELVITSDVNKTKFLRPRSKTKTRTTRPKLTRPRPEWQDQDRAFVPRLFVQYTYCLSSKQIPFSVFKRLLYLTYSKFNITILTISTTELHVCSLRINTPHILQRIRMHSLSQCSLSKCPPQKSKGLA